MNIHQWRAVAMKVKLIIPLLFFYNLNYACYNDSFTEFKCYPNTPNVNSKNVFVINNIKGLTSNYVLTPFAWDYSTDHRTAGRSVTVNSISYHVYLPESDYGDVWSGGYDSDGLSFGDTSGDDAHYDSFLSYETPSINLTLENQNKAFWLNGEYKIYLSDANDFVHNAQGETVRNPGHADITIPLCGVSYNYSISEKDPSQTTLTITVVNRIGPYGRRTYQSGPVKGVYYTVGCGVRLSHINPVATTQTENNALIAGDYGNEVFDDNPVPPYLELYSNGKVSTTSKNPGGFAPYYTSISYYKGDQTAPITQFLIDYSNSPNNYFNNTYQDNTNSNNTTAKGLRKINIDLKDQFTLTKAQIVDNKKRIIILQAPKDTTANGIILNANGFMIQPSTTSNGNDKINNNSQLCLEDELSLPTPEIISSPNNTYSGSLMCNPAYLNSKTISISGNVSNVASSTTTSSNTQNTTNKPSPSSSTEQNTEASANDTSAQQPSFDAPPSFSAPPSFDGN